MSYKGDFTPGKTVRLRFNTHQSDGTPITLAGTPAISVYKGSTTESTAGVSLTVDYDSRTGLHDVVIDTSADGTFYAAGNDFAVVITTGTVDSVSVVGTVVGSFSLSNRSALRPTTADRTLDVSATGEAGLDWANVGSPTTTVSLSGTTVGTLTTYTGNTPQTGDAYARLGAPVGASISADIAGVPAALLDLTAGVETNLTVRQLFRVSFAVLSGIANGGGTTTMHFRNLADSKNRVTATVDSSGNRSAITLDLT